MVQQRELEANGGKIRLDAANYQLELELEFRISDLGFPLNYESRGVLFLALLS